MLFVTLKAVRVVQVLRVLISYRKTHLIDIQFPEIVLIVRKCAGKDGLNAEVHFGSFEHDALPWLQSRLLKLKLDPFTSEVRFKYT